MVISLGGLRCVWCHVLGSIVLAYLYIELYKASAMKTSQLCGPQTLLQVKWPLLFMLI